jgi:hypothetical protein
MLENDPPSGTRVRFLRQVNKAAVSSEGSLVRSLGRYAVERPEDQFEVRFGDETYVVQRRDIVKATS